MKDNSITDTSPIDEDITFISESITKAASISIGKSKSLIKRNRVPWWNDEIKNTIKKKNKALKTFQTTNNPADHIKLKHLRTKTRYLVKNSKADSWKNFTSSLGPKADPSLIWNKVRSIRGFSKHHLIHIMKDSDLCTNSVEISNLLGNHFFQNSSDENFNKHFFQKQHQMRNQLFISTINPLLNEQLIFNSPIQLIEMNRALSKCTSLAPGPNGIPYSFIHNLPKSVLDTIIKVFNKIWSTGSIPQN